jgi:putative integral membrane protein (TIGR02587 family)
MRRKELVTGRTRPRSHLHRRSWGEQLDDTLRGMASGFLVGIPTVFTVDSWWLGEQLGPLDAIWLLVFSFLLTWAAVYWIGFHQTQRRGIDHAIDALEALAIAILSLIVIFSALGQIGDEQPGTVALGRIAVAVAPVSLGVAVANHLLPRDVSRYAPDPGDATSMRTHGKLSGPQRKVFELAAAFAGALFLCLAIVPVGDLNDIATATPLTHLPLVILLSLLVSYTVVFAAGFGGERKRHLRIAPGLNAFSETVVAYCIALVVAFAVLWIFGRIGPDMMWLEMYTKTVLLAFPASMAASAGRLAV